MLGSAVAALQTFDEGCRHSMKPAVRSMMPVLKPESLVRFCHAGVANAMLARWPGTTTVPLLPAACCGDLGHLE